MSVCVYQTVVSECKDGDACCIIKRAVRCKYCNGNNVVLTFSLTFSIYVRVHNSYLYCKLILHILAQLAINKCADCALKVTAILAFVL
jgi:hypothetical protein